MKYTPNLNNYKKLKPTESCYLDGRYFNMVFKDYPGLIEEPLYISFRTKGDEVEEKIWMNRADIDNRYLGILRIIIETDDSRHSNLLLIDYAGAKIYRFEPLGMDAEYFSEVNRLIEAYMDNYIDFDMEVFDTRKLDETNPECERGGFCVGFIIKFAYDYLNGRKYDPKDIRRFAALIEQKYGKLPEKGKDVEYGLFDGNSRAVLTTLGGAALGGLMTRSPAGLLAGGALGFLVGKAL